LWWVRKKPASAAMAFNLAPNARADFSHPAEQPANLAGWEKATGGPVRPRPRLVHSLPEFRTRPAHAGYIALKAGDLLVEIGPVFQSLPARLRFVTSFHIFTWPRGIEEPGMGAPVMIASSGR
jgi:hypothetical protein